MQSNPFTPGFGLTPPILAMTGTPVEDFADALTGRAAAGDRSVLISGPRGVGKTVLLAQFQDIARELGWIPVALHTSSTSMLAELREHAAHLLRDLDPDARTSRVASTSASLAGFGASMGREVIDRYDDEQVPTTILLDRLGGELTEQGRGLMVSVDEVQSAERNQLHELGQYMQDQIGHGHAVAFVAAGFTSGVDELLSHPKTTFLRRAQRVEVGSVDVGTAADVIAQTVAETAKTIVPEAAVRAGEISQGYPYLIQVVGAAAWDRSGDAPDIELEDVEGARAQVIDQMIRFVHGPALRDITGRKDQYLVAMLQDDGPSRVADIARRLGIDDNNQNVYRRRLIRDEMIRAAGHGLVEFALPYLREALLRRQSGDPIARGAGAARAARPVRATPASGPRPGPGDR